MVQPRRLEPRTSDLNPEPPNHARATPPATSPPSTAPSNPVHQNYDPDAPPSSSFAAGAIVVTVILLLTMLALLLYRSLTQSAPSAVLIVQGDPHWDGTRLLVTGGAGSRPTRLAGVLERSNKYNVTFFLAPGLYELRVMTDVSELARLPIDLAGENHHQLGVDLRRSKIPPPHPTTDESKE
jgi:hypothetical protein